MGRAPSSLILDKGERRVPLSGSFGARLLSMATALFIVLVLASK